jgi:hypothetical protein
MKRRLLFIFLLFISSFSIIILSLFIKIDYLNTNYESIIEEIICLCICTYVFIQSIIKIIEV